MLIITITGFIVASAVSTTGMAFMPPKIKLINLRAACAAQGGTWIVDGCVVCGDGKVGRREGCDDGNTVIGDGCSATCKKEVCTDTDGGKNYNVKGTTTAWDGYQATDLCHNPALIPECSGPDCYLSEYSCTNPILGSVAEENYVCPGGCKDGACRAKYCGDGIVQKELGESCEPPNSAGCDANCKAICGDGILTGTEACDPPGSTGKCAGTRACASTCTCPQPYCGDGILDSGEQCDDGNTNWYDGCSKLCKKEYCGDGVLQLAMGEECENSGIFAYECAPNCKKYTVPVYTCDCGVDTMNTASGPVVTSEYDCDAYGCASVTAAKSACLAKSSRCTGVCKEGRAPTAGYYSGFLGGPPYVTPTIWKVECV